MKNGHLTETELVVVVTVPHRVLSPNGASHVHWRVRHRATKYARAEAKMVALSVLNGATVCPVGYSLRYFWKGMHRDDDNAIASAKAHLDGICSAIGMDDRGLRFRRLEHHKDRARPRLEVVMHLV